MFTDTQLREVFHFCFLERLLKISDPRLYALKGDVNLRFYFNSPRYSEDMDLDVFAGNVATLKKNGYKILQDKAFLRSLRSYGVDAIELNDPIKAKQTETTQRFRFALITSSGLRLPTKVEFSRRKDSIEDPVLELINPEIARHYRKLSYQCQHYSGEVAVVQKVLALAGRSITQARNVFDLGILFNGGFTKSFNSNAVITNEILQQASDALLSLQFEDYEGQVVEYLEPEYRTQYGLISSWQQLQETILDLLNNA